MLTHRNVELEAGTYQMKVTMVREGPSTSIADIDYFKFVKE
jgi:hypothetical protein